MKRILLIASAAALVSCGGSKEPREVSAKNEPMAVQAFTVSQTEWPSGYEAVGTVRAKAAAAISAKVMGYVREVNVRVGDRVRQGQKLVVLDARDLDAGYRQAEAARNEARNAIPEAENGISAAKANLELAKSTFGRMKELFDKQSISNQEFDEASAKLKVAQAGYEMAAAKRTQLESKIAQADEALRSAEVMKSYAEITAPFDGIVTEKPVEPGSLSAPGAPLLTIEREGAYRLEAGVEESKLNAVKLGQQVTVRLDAIDTPLAGRVTEIVPAVDSASRAFTVKIELPSVRGLRSGLYGRATFPSGTRQVTAVPAGSVTERGQLASVFVVDAGAAKARLVTLGERAQDRVEVLSGITSGERIVNPVPAGLKDGAAVEVRP